MSLDYNGLIFECLSSCPNISRINKGTQNKVHTQEVLQLKVVKTFYLVEFYG